LTGEFLLRSHEAITLGYFIEGLLVTAFLAGLCSGDLLLEVGDFLFEAFFVVLENLLIAGPVVLFLLDFPHGFDPLADLGAEFFGRAYRDGLRVKRQGRNEGDDGYKWTHGDWLER
jgi:hypothetical protein